MNKSPVEPMIIPKENGKKNAVMIKTLDRKQAEMHFRRFILGIFN